MSDLENFEWRWINCGEFHEYGQWKCFDLGWENQPRTCWEGYENSNSWNPPYHQYYGDHEHQPLEHEEPHQGHGGGKKSLEKLLEGFITRMDNNYNNREINRTLAISLSSFWRRCRGLSDLVKFNFLF